ncbi:VF530 family DNA-binding protein [Marinicellulosiphila megalodicopiae]|uniref:VF530 family DNA-binding protein n=1 Tax=Marinicellulosiphila megalodicopiae TaxID=2724896 RepID=UPI003BAF2522
MSEQDNPEKKQPSNDPLHGVRLDRVVTELTQRFSWEILAKKIPLNCFKSNQSVKSTLKFLRKTPWARQKVETLWVWTFVDKNYIPPSSERSKIFLEKQKKIKESRGFNPWLDK